MSEELLYRLRCDYPIRKKGGYKKCDVHVEIPTLFMFDGQEYTVDLCDDCKLRVIEGDLATLLKIARADSAKVMGHARRILALLPNGQAVTATDVRIWAQENDVPVSPTGRIKQEVYDLYNEVHGIKQ